MKTLTTKGTTPQEGANSSNQAPASVADCEAVANNPAAIPASGRARVLMEFQRTSLEMSRQFLETQQNVMLAYLNAGAQRTDVVVQNCHQRSVQLQTAVAVENQAAFPNTIQEQSLDYRNVAQNIVAQTVDTAPQVIQERELAAIQSSSEDLIVSLIEIVSERTGYPPEMLDPTLDLEADLGIDSIKRVEILNSFRKRLPESSQKSLEGGIEQLAGVKSLQGIIDWIKTELATDTTTMLQESSK